VSGMASANASRPIVAPPIPEMDFDWTVQVGLSLLVLTGMLGGFFLVARQLRGGRPLTERQRADFATRLRTALAKGDDGVQSRP
jgi:hypothetical protein